MIQIEILLHLLNTTDVTKFSVTVYDVSIVVAAALSSVYFPFSLPNAANRPFDLL